MWSLIEEKTEKNEKEFHDRKKRRRKNKEVVEEEKKGEEEDEKVKKKKNAWKLVHIDSNCVLLLGTRVRVRTEVISILSMDEKS